MKRGQIDQILTSVIVLFVVFVLMVLFVVISSNIGSLRQTFSFSRDAPIHLFSSQQAVNSRVMADLFLSDTVIIDGSRVPVTDAFEIVSKAVQAYSVNDKKALSTLNALQTLFESRYSCGGVNHFSFMVKNPMGSSKIGSYWMYIDYPVLSWKGKRLDTPMLQPNIIDLINGRATDSSNYIGQSYSFLDGLEQPTRDNYIAYPRVDLLNDRPTYIALLRGETTC